MRLTSHPACRQRSFIRNAVAALPPASSLAAQIKTAFAEIEVHLPFNTSGFHDVRDRGNVKCGTFMVGFAGDGSITRLCNSHGKCVILFICCVTHSSTLEPLCHALSLPKISRSCAWIYVYALRCLPLLFTVVTHGT